MSSVLFTNQWLKMSTHERKNDLKLFTGGLEPIIICLDDEESILEVVQTKIEDYGFRVLTTNDPERAKNLIQSLRSAVALVISDYKMPAMDGFSFREQILSMAPDIPFVILSGYVDREMALKGLDAKIAAFLQKPIDDNELFQNIAKICSPRLITIRDDRELLKGFVDDACNLVEMVESLILELEDNPSDLDIVAKIFGCIHTIKGSSGFFEPRTLHKFAHRFEDTLKEVQSGQMMASPTVISVWLKSCDTLKTLIDEMNSGDHTLVALEELTKIFNDLIPDLDCISPTHLKQGLSTPTNEVVAPAAAATQRPRGAQELKVSVGLLDEFMQISGEMTVIRNMINKIVKSIEKQYPSDKEVSLLGDLLGELHKINGSVQSKITELRKVPVKSVVKPIVRIVRDTSLALKKEVELKIEGEDLRIDTSVAETLSNSLVHLVRNSLDHGIESPEERLLEGKGRKGELLISAKVKDETILVEIKDNGRGISAENIRKKLISNGTHSLEQVSKMTLMEIYQMIFSPGFSTAPKITDLSGRGVGLSMVKDVVEAMGGKILIDSKPLEGTQFTLCIPIPKSVLITNCLFVTSKQMQFGIPQDQIIRILQTLDAKEKGHLDFLEGAPVFKHDEQLLPVISLEAILNGETHKQNANWADGYFVVVSSNHQSFCIWVDSVHDVEDSVVKALSTGQIKNLGLYSGATFLGDGSIGLILNIEGLALRAGVQLSASYAKDPLPEKREDSDSHTTNYALNVVLCEGVQQMQYALPQEIIFRLEEFNLEQIEQEGAFFVAPYRNHVLTFIDLEGLLSEPRHVSPRRTSVGALKTLVIQHKSGFLGIVVHCILDLITLSSPPEIATTKQVGSSGWVLVGDRIVQLIDIDELIGLISTATPSSPVEPQLAAVY